MNVKPIPEGYHTITPYFSARNARKLIEFLEQAFDGQVLDKTTLPDGTVMNAQVKVGDSMLMVGEAAKDMGGRSLMPAMLYMYVEDADAVYAKAIRAGAKSVMEPIDQFYGDRSGAVEDLAGNQWWIATRKEDVSAEELVKRSLERKK
jgi:PhnB protein